ncbi:MAG: hypothetical protein WCF90_06680 [Methanomicrobiales archaeon]
MRGILFTARSFIIDILGTREFAGLSTVMAARSLIVSLFIVVFVFEFCI